LNPERKKKDLNTPRLKRLDDLGPLPSLKQHHPTPLIQSELQRVVCFSRRRREEGEGDLMESVLRRRRRREQEQGRRRRRETGRRRVSFFGKEHRRFEIDRRRKKERKRKTTHPGKQRILWMERQRSSIVQQQSILSIHLHLIRTTSSNLRRLGLVDLLLLVLLGRRVPRLDREGGSDVEF